MQCNKIVEVNYPFHLVMCIIAPTGDLSAFRDIHDILYLLESIISLNRHQPKKSLSITVGARVVLAALLSAEH
jgi:hypothetical protein